MKTETLELIVPFIREATHVGSRITCDPAPTGTDDDILVLVNPVPQPPLPSQPYAEHPMWALRSALEATGWQLGGSAIDNDSDDKKGVNDGFNSWTKGEENLICTSDPVFHSRFLTATRLARHLNLLDKKDRIALFQAVLYGNAEGLPELVHFEVGMVPQQTFSDWRSELDELI